MSLTVVGSIAFDAVETQTAKRDRAARRRRRALLARLLVLRRDARDRAGRRRLRRGGVRRPARPRRDHRRHRARRRAARRSSGPAATSATSTSATRCRPTSTSSSTSSRSCRRPRAAADVAVPGQHPARPAARGARAVRGAPLQRAGLDEPVDRHRPRVAAADDRDGRLRAAQRRRGPPADRRAEPRPRRAQGCSTMGPRVVVAKQGEYGAAMFTRDGVFGLPAYPTADVVDPTGAGDTFAGGFMGYVAAHAGEELDRRAAAPRDGLRHRARLLQRRGVRHRARCRRSRARRSPPASPSCSTSARFEAAPLALRA